MYEFTKKEIRQEFKKTKYGKKVNIYLYGSLIGWLILFISSILSIILYTNDNNLIFIMVGAALSFLASIALIIMCYFDGKRDGAIKQFEISSKDV